MRPNWLGRSCRIRPNQFHDFAEFPDVVCNSSFHSRSNAQGLMYSAEVVIHEVQRQRVLVILNLLGERIREPGETSHVHPHGEVLPLNVTSRNVIPVGIPDDGRCNSADTLRGTVARFWPLRFVAVQLDQHRVVNLRPKSYLNGGQISSVAVCSQLNAVGDTRSQIVHEVLRVPRIASANAPARNNLGVSAESRPRPDIAIAKLAAQIGGNVLFFRVAERPNLIALDSLAWQIAQGLVLIFRARLSNPRQQLNNGVFRYSRHSHRSANRVSFDKSRNHCNLPFHWEVVHV